MTPTVFAAAVTTEPARREDAYWLDPGIFSLAGGGCQQRAAEDQPPEFISELGGYKLYDGQVEVEVAETSNGFGFKVLHHRNEEASTMQ